MLVRKAYRDIVTRRVRTTLTLLGVIVGVAGLVAIVTTARGLARAQRDLFASGGRADMALALYNAPPSIARVVERVRGVAAAELRFNHYGRGRLGAGAPLDDLHFLGLRSFEPPGVDRLVLLEGTWPGAREALVEPAAAARAGLRVGDTLFYRDANQRERPLRVSGIARLPAALSADITGIPLLFVPDSIVRDMLDVPGFNELLVRLEPGARPQETGEAIVAALVQRQIPRGVPRFYDPQNFVGKRELDALFITLYLFSGLGVLLSGFIVGNTLAALVAESVREIGILKALGATRAQVVGGFLLAALLYGIVGTGLGLLAGSGLGFVLLRLLGRVASLAPPFRLEPLALLLGTVVGLAVTLVGGGLPAWRAAGITPKAALESLGVSRHFGQSWLDRGLQRLAVLPPLPAMGLRNLLRRKGRSAVTALVVGVAVAALLAAQATDRSVTGEIERIFSTYPADAYLQFGETASSSDAGSLRRVAGVRHAEGWLLRPCSAALARARCWAMPADTRMYRPALVAGGWLDPRDPTGVVVSSDLARAQRLAVGDRFPLRYREAERAVTVRGIVVDNAIFLGSDIQSKVFAPHELFAALVGQEGAADLFALTLEPRTQAAQQQVLNEVDRKLAALRPSSTLALTEFETSQEQSRILTSALRGMVLLVALVGAMGLVNTLALNVLERRREIGVLRALGTDNRQLALLFLVEGVGLGALGWALGLVLGWGLGYSFVGALSATLFQIPYRFPPTFALTSLLFALALSLAASVAPALAAASIPTIEAIRYE